MRAHKFHTSQTLNSLTIILAVLDYARRAHEIEFRPSSVVSPSVSQLFLYLKNVQKIFQLLAVVSPMT